MGPRSPLTRQSGPPPPSPNPRPAPERRDGTHYIGSAVGRTVPPGGRMAAACRRRVAGDLRLHRSRRAGGSFRGEALADAGVRPTSPFRSKRSRACSTSEDGTRSCAPFLGSRVDLLVGAAVTGCCWDRAGRSRWAGHLDDGVPPAATLQACRPRRTLRAGLELGAADPAYCRLWWPLAASAVKPVSWRRRGREVPGLLAAPAAAIPWRCSRT
jgi:hypothetical protein